MLFRSIYEYHDAQGEMFGEARVEALVAAHRGGSMRALADRLLAAVKAFARGAPQQDDITIVLVKHDALA